MKNIKLGVNIDHVATVRNARGEKYPSPLRAALISEKYGAHSVTIHLREDRRHINDNDLREIKAKIKIPLNLEIAATAEMLKIALRHQPYSVCIVPEKRKEITTEGGLNLNYKEKFLKESIIKMRKKGIRVSLFIEPNFKDINKAKKLNSNCIEIHTGKICDLINKKKPYIKELNKIKNIREFNIGHFLVGESIFIGLKKVILNFKNILK